MTSLLRFLLILVLVRGLAMLVEGLFLSEALSLLLVTILSGVASGHGLRLRFDTREAMRQLRFGFPLYGNTILAYAATRLNTLLIAWMAGPVAVSYFSVAARVPDQLSMILRSYIQVYLPNMSRLMAAHDRLRARRLLGASLRLMGFCFAILATALALFRHEVMGLLAPASYQVAAVAIPLLAGGLVFGAWGSILGNTLVASGDSRTPLLINIWTTIFSIALHVVLIRSWGFVGAAVATLLFNLSGYVVTDIVVSRRLTPAGRGYLAVVTIMGGLMIFGLHAHVLVRIGILVGGACACLLVAPTLRQDLAEAWKGARQGRLMQPLGATGKGSLSR